MGLSSWLMDYLEITLSLCSGLYMRYHQDIDHKQEEDKVLTAGNVRFSK